MNKLVWVGLCAIVTVLGLGCGHETKSALEKLEADKSVSDDKALVEMAKASWIFAINDNEKFTASKTAEGKYRLIGYTRDSTPSTVLSQENLLKINMQLDAKYMWRLFRSGIERGLDEMVYTHKTAVIGGEVDLFRVRLTAAQLKTVSGWDSADPYSTGEHDVLDTDQALAVIAGIMKTWKVELDNSSKITVN